MSTIKLLFRGSVVRVSHTAISIVLAFFMMPFMISSLGDEWYGVWAIIGGIIATYYILDFGLSSAVTKYISQHLAEDDFESANRIINTSLVIYSILGVIVFLSSLVVAYFANYFVDAEQNLYTIQLVIVISGLSLALEFPYKSFAGIVNSYMRYDLLTYSRLATMLLSAGLIVYYLSDGHGIITVAVITFVTAQIANLLFYLIARHLYKGMQISRRFVNRPTAKKLYDYSFWAFVITLANMLRGRIDVFIIGSILSAAAVTHYYIAERLVEYVRQFLYQATNIFMPVFTRYLTQGNMEEAKSKMLLIIKLSAVMAGFAIGVLIIVAGSFIDVWMGDKYASAYPVLVALIVGKYFEFVGDPCCTVLYASENHNILAKCDILEGIANLSLSLLLIYPYGLTGVAIATMVPLIFFRLLVVPPFVCRILGLSLARYYLNLLAPLLFTLGYMFLADWIFNSYLAKNAGYAEILLFAVLALPVYAIISFFLFNKEQKQILVTLLPDSIRRRFFAAWDTP